MYDLLKMATSVPTDFSLPFALNQSLPVSLVVVRAVSAPRLSRQTDSSETTTLFSQ
jgi:hypothetical protein